MFQPSRLRPNASRRLRPAAVHGSRAAPSMLRLSQAAGQRLPTAASLDDWMSRAGGALHTDFGTLDR